MKKALLPLFILMLASCAQYSVWTKSYESEVYKGMYRGLSGVRDSSQRRLLAQYTTEKLKKKLPYGLASVSKARLDYLCEKIADDFNKTYDIENFQSGYQWTPENEAMLKGKLVKNPSLQHLNKEQREEYCNCFIMNLKAAMPDSVRTPIPDTIMHRVTAGCGYLLKKK